MKRLVAAGRIAPPLKLHHWTVGRTVEVHVADEATGHRLRGRQIVPAGLQDPRGATSYELERMLREAASITGEEWSR